ncbi:MULTISPECIES: DGQHR domain-containing protein [unclassified Arcicella]|uniref:DGQHR domain-containing protein n=1 Tax=unclassified Arcicella TaxID=2644986 RepID=UPI002859A158|nr:MULTISPECIES: DGQHR domain-containing protein [unclassified Arcicella]MDR6563575.1 DGQHR domain-containing protein [Arcicella sp. BE51]MDR6813313.1 DGQHR domain-containing protein [Arcicella sp. BE140]MDR6824627.1 DGQHR domain-containing protein [Arcicella sp. BE139]
MFNTKVLTLSHKNITYYLCKITGAKLATMTYVARRREDDEEGAVQRILNKSRISAIKDFIISGGYFPNNVILNFGNASNVTVEKDNDTVSISDDVRIAQIIDGQHRIEGIKEAIKNDPLIGEVEFPVIFGIGLSTAQCAEIFLSINTEQKVVPKSLIYDLYSLTNITSRDFSIDRSNDIAIKLNEDNKSPYYGYIKFPSSKKFKGGIQLATVVSNLKVFVKEEGEFKKYSLTSLENQTVTLLNYFTAIEKAYGNWDSLKNPFLYASGFGAALDVLQHRILAIGYSKKEFTVDFFKSIVKFDRHSLPTTEIIKGMSGDKQRNVIKDKLLISFDFEETNENEIKF